MFSGDKELTGHSVNPFFSLPKKEPVLESDYKIPFGVNKDKSLSEVQPHYLKWIVSDKFDPQTDNAIRLRKQVELYLEAQGG